MLRPVISTSRIQLGNVASGRITTRITPSLARQRLLKPQRSLPFSTQFSRQKEQTSPSQKVPEAKTQANTNPELPKFSLEGLGISKNMRLLLIGLIGVFGTMETYTYYKWIRKWYYGESKDGDATAAGT